MAACTSLNIIFENLFNWYYFIWLYTFSSLFIRTVAPIVILIIAQNKRNNCSPTTWTDLLKCTFSPVHNFSSANVLSSAHFLQCTISPVQMYSLVHIFSSANVLPQCTFSLVKMFSITLYCTKRGQIVKLKLVCNISTKNKCKTEIGQGGEGGDASNRANQIWSIKYTYYRTCTKKRIIPIMKASDGQNMQLMTVDRTMTSSSAKLGSSTL